MSAWTLAILVSTCRIGIEGFNDGFSPYEYIAKTIDDLRSDISSLQNVVNLQQEKIGLSEKHRMNDAKKIKLLEARIGHLEESCNSDVIKSHNNISRYQRDGKPFIFILKLDLC